MKHRIRKDLLNLDKVELQALNDGFEALVAIEGHGGYQHIAGVYGKPGQSYRPTTPYLFLPWHRAYLMAFEQMLGRAWPGTTLPYWDWTDEATCKNGIPTRLRSVAYSDKDQGIWLNALCRAPIDCLGHQYYTQRVPGKPADMEPTVRKTTEACLQTCFEEFSNELEEASKEFRAWVGGHISDDDFAAYDPLFWFHHANLDRIWADWQQVHPNSIPERLFDVTMEPFAVKVGAIVNRDQLGYIYSEVPPAGTRIDKRA